MQGEMKNRGAAGTAAFEDVRFAEPNTSKNTKAPRATQSFVAYTLDPELRVSFIYPSEVHHE
jgi:hypothetical protein